MPIDRDPNPVERDLRRLLTVVGERVRAERHRRRLKLSEVGELAGVAPATVHYVETGRTSSMETYVRVARALHLRLEIDLVDPRRRRTKDERPVDPVHAAMGEFEVARFRKLGFGTRVDEPYQHFQFAGRGDAVAWSAEGALRHIENKTEFRDLQDAFGAFSAKRAYLGRELAERLGVKRWTSHTHVMAVLPSVEALRAIRRHRASFSSVCPDPPGSFVAWWSGRPPGSGSHSTLVVLDPIETGKAPAAVPAQRWIGLEDIDSAKPRYRNYKEAAAALRSEVPA